jgi:hypothetical protein
MDNRDVVRLLSVARAAVGVLWLVAPHKVIKAWTGEDAASVSARVVGRGFGGRDLALAVGTLLTREDGRALAMWLKAGALSDAADAVSTLATYRKLGSARGLFWTATAAATTALGLRLAGAVAHGTTQAVLEGHDSGMAMKGSRRLLPSRSPGRRWTATLRAESRR